MLHKSDKKFWVQILNPKGHWQFYGDYSSYEKAHAAALELYKDWCSARLLVLNSNGEYDFEEFIR